MDSRTAKLIRDAHKLCRDSEELINKLQNTIEDSKQIVAESRRRQFTQDEERSEYFYHNQDAEKKNR